MRSETGRAVLAATAALTAAPAGPSLSELLDRIATTRGLAFSTGPSPASEGMPARGSRSSRAEGRLISSRRGRTAVRSRGVALLGAHGGAGVSCLLRAGLDAAGCSDAERIWPVTGPALLVARTSTHGLEQARDLAREHAAGTAGLGASLIGLVLVADAPGRLPARIAGLADLVSGALPRCWQVPWLPQWRLAATAEPLPVHPDVARLIRDIHHVTSSDVASPGLTYRPCRPTLEGVLP